MASEDRPPIDWSAPISTEDAARLLGLTTARIRQLISSGHIERTGRGKTTAASAARGLAKFWEEKSSEKTKTSSDSRVRDARAAEIEQRMQIKSRDLVPAKEATAAVDHVIAACAEAFAMLPAMITRDVAERNRIEKHVKRAQGEVAKRLSEAARVLREGGSLPDAD